MHGDKKRICLPIFLSVHSYMLEGPTQVDPDTAPCLGRDVYRLEDLMSLEEMLVIVLLASVAMCHEIVNILGHSIPVEPRCNFLLRFILANMATQAVGLKRVTNT